MTDLAPHPANGNTDDEGIAPDRDVRKRCACGCGRVIPKGATYARGHWARTAEARRKNSEAAKARAAEDRRTLRALSADPPLEDDRSVSEQAIPEEVSERLFTADDVVVMLNLLDVEQAKIEKFIDLTALLDTLR